MITFRQTLASLIGVLSFVSVFYSVGKLMLFLSTPINLTFEAKLLNAVLENNDLMKASLFALCIDAALAIVFILQHSCMKSELVKRFWTRIGLESAERSIYNIVSALTLVFMLHNWKFAPAFALWNFAVGEKTNCWWLLIVFHGLLWVVIYGGSILLDFAELLGIKQVYYDINDLAPPMSYKSVELKRLLSHVRHPSFVAKALILWTTNFMSLDRLLLAVLWTVYMYVAWNTDTRDVAYQKRQLSRKKFELDHDLTR